MLRGPHNARCVDGFEGFGFEPMVGAGFDLDERDGAIAFDDEVDFPDRGFVAAVSDAVEFELQEKRCQRFAALTTAFGNLPFIAEP
jgi:hypothetical protein